MRLSTDRILTSHVGSLPRPDARSDLLLRREFGEHVDADVFSNEVLSAVKQAVARQVEEITLARKKHSVKLYQAGHPGAAALAGATEAAWLLGDDIRPVPLDQIGAPPQPGAALLVRYPRRRAR